MATKNFVPRATGQGQIGTTSKRWLRHNAISGSFTHVSASVFQVTDLLGDISYFSRFKFKSYTECQ